jgi:hypothetical protein
VRYKTVPVGGILIITSYLYYTHSSSSQQERVVVGMAATFAGPECVRMGGKKKV